MAGSEQSIKIKDLIYIILRAWRQLLIFALVGIIFLSGFAIYRGRTAKKPSKQAVTLTDKEIEEITQKSLTGDPEILERTERLESLGIRSEYLSNRLANSIYLSINEDAQPLVKLEIVVIPELPLPTSGETYEQREYFLSLGFLKVAKGDEFVDYLAEQCMQRVEAKWIRELLTFYLDDNHVLHFEVTAPDLGIAEDLAEASQIFFKDTIREYLSITYLFDVEISDSEVSVSPNPAILTERKQLERELDGVRLAFDQEQDAIDLKVEETLDQALEEKIALQIEKESEKPKVSLKRTMLKYGIAGAFIGILIAAFIAVFRATSSAIIWSPEEFADQLKLLYIGMLFAPQDADKKPLSGIDRWLEKLFYQVKGSDGDESISYVTSIIEGLERKKGKISDIDQPYTVAVIGESGNPAMEKLVESLGELTSIQGIGVIADTAEGIKALRSADAVVQLVQARKTGLRKAIRDLELASSMGVEILGIVGVESV